MKNTKKLTGTFFILQGVIFLLIAIITSLFFYDEILRHLLNGNRVRAKMLFISLLVIIVNLLIYLFSFIKLRFGLQLRKNKDKEFTYSFFKQLNRNTIILCVGLAIPLFGVILMFLDIFNILNL